MAPEDHPSASQSTRTLPQEEAAPPSLIATALSVLWDEDSETFHHLFPAFFWAAAHTDGPGTVSALGLLPKLQADKLPARYTPCNTLASSLRRYRPAAGDLWELFHLDPVIRPVINASITAREKLEEDFKLVDRVSSPRLQDLLDSFSGMVRFTEEEFGSKGAEMARLACRVFLVRTSLKEITS